MIFVANEHVAKQIVGYPPFLLLETHDIFDVIDCDVVEICGDFYCK